VERKIVKSFFLSLVVLLLISYGIAMTVSTVYYVKKVSSLKLKVFSLELVREEMKKRVDNFSSGSTELEAVMLKLQKKFNSLDKESQEKTDELSRQIKEYENKIQVMEKKLTKTEGQLAGLRKKNKEFESSSLKAAQREAGEAEFEEVIAEKEMELKKVNAKVKELQEGLKLKESTIHYNLGVNFFQRQDLENAIIEYKKALEANPNHSSSCYNLGVIYEEHKKDYPQALKYYNQYLALSTDKQDIPLVEQWITDLKAKVSDKTAE